VRAEELEDSPRSPFVVHIGQEVWKLMLQKACRNMQQEADVM
jgi:hypothetical protein